MDSITSSRPGTVTDGLAEDKDIRSMDELQTTFCKKLPTAHLGTTPRDEPGYQSLSSSGRAEQEGQPLG
jgi:hypothetical protein